MTVSSAVKICDGTFEHKVNVGLHLGSYQ